MSLAAALPSTDRPHNYERVPMKRSRIWLAGLLTLAGMAGCGNSPFSSTQKTLTGQVYLTAPLDGATVSFQTAAGTTIDLASAGTTTQGRFREQLSLLSPMVSGDIQWVSSYLPLTVTVTGGTVDGKPFDGTLLGYVTSFSADRDVHVNVLTTLIVKYKQAAGVTFEQAEAAVKARLHIPADVDLANTLNNPNQWHHMDPTRFMAQAQANGGFDAFTDQLTTQLTGSQPVGVALTAEGEGGTIGSAVASFLKAGVGEGLTAWTTEKVMGWILSAFGYKNPTEQALDEIKDQLNQMNATLNQINAQITTLTNQMSQLLSLVQLSWDSLTSTMSSLNMTIDENAIQNEYNNLSTGFPASSPDLCTATGNTIATAFAQQILGTSVDIDQHVYNIYANLAGKNAGSNGALYDLTSKLVDQVIAGQDLYNCYIVLENYFGQVAAIQAQGLDLMIEGLHQTQTPLDSSMVTTFLGGATDYYNKFNSQMNDEVDMFLSCVDRLVMAKVDVRSEIVLKFAYLSPETAAIYNRADFVACRLSTNHPAGLNIRLIGDPTHVADWIANNRIQVAGHNPTVVAVNGNTTNNYAPLLPASTPSGVTHYLEWMQKGNAYTFDLQTNVSIVKLNYPSTVAGSFAVTTPDAAQNQTLTVSLYNDSFQPASSTDVPIVAYGSGVFYARALPTWQTGEPMFFQNATNTFAGSWTPDANNVQMTLSTYPCYIEPWIMVGCTFQGQLLTTIINGGTNKVSVGLNWNGTQNTTRSWGSGGASTSANQSLICQTTTQTIKASGQTQGQPLAVTLAPNTSTPITYQASQSWSSTNVLHYGWYLTTNAWLNSLEIVPKQ